MPLAADARVTVTGCSPVQFWDRGGIPFIALYAIPADAVRAAFGLAVSFG